MQLHLLQDKFCVCKIDNLRQVDLKSDFFFIAKTPDEVSLVCKEVDAPEDSAVVENGWRGLRVAGTLDFSLVGILAEISSTLAKAGVPIFAVSTYDTDYILIKEEYIDKAMSALTDSGYTII